MAMRSFVRALKNWWRDVWADPGQLAAHDLLHRGFPGEGTGGGGIVFPDHPRVPTQTIQFQDGSELRHEGGKVTGFMGSSGRMMFPAPEWVVPAAGPNEPGPSLAEQFFPRLVDYDWAVLFDAAGLTGRLEPIIAGAAFNECSTFLRKMGALDLMGKPRELGHQLIAMKQADMLKRPEPLRSIREEGARDQSGPDYGEMGTVRDRSGPDY